MFIVGLTGGIASGKSTASQYFESLGITVIDADVIARQLVEPGLPALQQISTRFGTAVLDASGRLNRAALRSIIFSNDTARSELEAILHPLIRAEMQRQVAALSGIYCMLAIPLLVETNQADLVDRILVIDTEEQQQYQRLRQRDGLDEATIKAMIQAQASRAQRRAVADDIASNNDSVAALQVQLQQFHQRYLQLSQP